MPSRQLLRQRQSVSEKTLRRPSSRLLRQRQNIEMDSSLLRQLSGCSEARVQLRRVVLPLSVFLVLVRESPECVSFCALEVGR